MLPREQPDKTGQSPQVPNGLGERLRREYPQFVKETWEICTFRFARFC